MTNCPRLFSLAQRAADVCELPAPFLQSEDFSAYARCCPSLYMFLGAGDTYPLHSPYFDFDESVLKRGWKPLSDSFSVELLMQDFGAAA